MKIDGVPAVMEVEVESENKREDKYTNRIVSDCDISQEENKMG